jgi:hypothetical protein
MGRKEGGREEGNFIFQSIVTAESVEEEEKEGRGKEEYVKLRSISAEMAVWCSKGGSLPACSVGPKGRSEKM